jgi:hypothetical protein
MMTVRDYSDKGFVMLFQGEQFRNISFFSRGNYNYCIIEDTALYSIGFFQAAISLNAVEPSNTGDCQNVDINIRKIWKKK